jgi:cysteine desulfuration protein SufE
MAALPPALEEIVAFFGNLSEAQRRDALLVYAEEAPRHAPRKSECYLISDERIDPSCTDKVGLFALRHPDGGLSFRARFGPEVQTLTRALVVILCRGLDGAPTATVANLPDDFVAGIVGEPLMRSRSRSVYQVLQRLRETANRIDALGPETAYSE